MQIITNFPSLIERSLRYRFQTIVVVCFLLWTLLLVIETLQVQHSCHPMIHWSGTLRAECQPKLLQPNSSSSKKPGTVSDRSQAKIAQRYNIPSPKPSSIPQRQTPGISRPPQQPEKPYIIEDFIKTAKEHRDIAGGVIGIGVGITVGLTALASAPLAIAVVVGAAVWFAIRTAL